MTDLFRELDDEWPRYIRSRDAKLDFAMWSRRDPSIASFADLPALYEHLRSKLTGYHELMAALAERSKVDRTARRLALQLMVPGLASAARRYRPIGEPADTQAHLVEYSLRRLASWNPKRPVVFAAAIVLEAKRELFVSCRAQAQELRELGPSIDLNGRDVMSDRDVVDESSPVIEQAVARGIVSQFDADVVMATRVLGFSASRVAHDIGMNEGTLRKRRRSVERVLAAQFRDVA